MEKTIHGDEYQVVIELLKQLRRDTGLTQTQMAAQLDQTQSLYSKYERGEIRLDVIQLRTIASILGFTLTEFSRMLEQRLAGKTIRPAKRRRPSA